ncbi:MAG: ice-binding family protein [Gallionella sp.]|nr:ice-binding family protein [Gallionella sp.]
MNRFDSISKPLMWSTTILLAAIVAGCGGNGDGVLGTTISQPGTVCTGASCVNLGTAGNYAILANTGIDTAPGASVITGNIATGPGVTSTAITGFALNLPAASPYATSTQVSGKVYAFDYAPPTPAEVNTASLDMGTAYTAAVNMAPAGGGLTTACPGVGALGGLTISPGVYNCSVAISIATDVTLSGSATDVWVIRTTQGLDQATATTVHLIGGALPQNVFWQAAGAVTVGSTAHFEGIILGQTAITFGNASSINGRVLAQTAVNLDMTTVTQP